GTLVSNSGTLSLNTGGSSSGSFSAGASGILNFGGGTHTLASSSSLLGGGTISISSGQVDVGGTYTFPGTILVSGGTANFNNGGTAFFINLTGGTLGGSGTLEAFKGMT